MKQIGIEGYSIKLKPVKTKVLNLRVPLSKCETVSETGGIIGQPFVIKVDFSKQDEKEYE